jgi:hypothetical protein
VQAVLTRQFENVNLGANFARQMNFMFGGRW